MRTHKEFQKQMQDAHDCEKCHGKIFCVSINESGLTRCTYCNQVVHYPHASKEEMRSWMLEKESEGFNI